MEITPEQCEKEYGEELKDILSDLHQYPELSGQEYRTTEQIKKVLDHLGVEILDIGTKTGVVARLSGGKGPVIGLRADIDGITQTEKVDRPDSSRNEGVMHGCGHDIHMTGLLGAAMVLSQERERLKGDVVFIFQPAEESLTGAGYLIHECGLFQKVPMDAVFGLHNDPELPIGTVGVRAGQLMSYKDKFTIRFIGRSGHSSKPHKNVDPIVAASSFIQSIQTIVSRNTDPLDSAVISVCQLHAGNPSNLVVEDAYLSGNIRTLTKETRERVLQRFERIANETADMYECQIEMDCEPVVPGVFNSENLYQIARKAAEDTVGSDHVREPSLNLASEDFSLYGQHVPAFFYFLGSGAPDRDSYSWHSAYFYPDQRTPYYGAALLARSVLEAQDNGVLFDGKIS